MPSFSFFFYYSITMVNQTHRWCVTVPAYPSLPILYIYIYNTTVKLTKRDAGKHKSFRRLRGYMRRREHARNERHLEIYLPMVYKIRSPHAIFMLQLSSIIELLGATSYDSTAFRWQVVSEHMDHDQSKKIKQLQGKADLMDYHGTH